jgi:hypothetical protein
MACPYRYYGPSFYLAAFFDDLTMKYTTQIRGRHVWLMLSEQVLARWGLHESHELPPLGYACSIEPAHCQGHQNSQHSGKILDWCFVCCRPGDHRGDTDQAVAQWRCSMASGVALVMLHWEICSVFLQCIRVAIKIARNGGTFVCRRRLFCLA